MTPAAFSLPHEELHPTNRGESKPGEYVPYISLGEWTMFITKLVLRKIPLDQLDPHEISLKSPLNHHSFPLNPIEPPWHFCFDLTTGPHGERLEKAVRVAYESTLEHWAVGGRHSFKTKYKAPPGSVAENSGFLYPPVN